MKILIVYDRPRLEINGWFAEKLKGELTSLGCPCEIVLKEEITVKDITADGIVMRCVDYDFSLKGEERGIRVFNPAELSEIANDKWKSYRYAESLGVKIPQTEVVKREELSTKEYPKVLKSRDGHGGTDVHMVKCASEALAAFDKIGSESVILQDVVSDLGRDVRVYFLGKKILKAVLRTSKNDFRSNFCLGGKAEAYNLSKAEEMTAMKIKSGLKSDFIGVDFIFDKGKIVFNEIEDVVGCRMLYKLGICDPVKLYAEYIYKNLK